MNLLYTSLELIFAIMALGMGYTAKIALNFVNRIELQYFKWYGLIIFSLSVIHLFSPSTSYWIANTWLLLRTVSPIILLLMLNGITNKKTSIAFLTTIAIVTAFILPFKGLQYTGGVISRPLEIVPMLLNILLFVRVLKRPTTEDFRYTIESFALLCISSHVVIMFSNTLFDNPFVVGHILQILSLVPFYIYFNKTLRWT